MADVKSIEDVMKESATFGAPETVVRKVSFSSYPPQEPRGESTDSLLISINETSGFTSIDSSVIFRSATPKTPRKIFAGVSPMRPTIRRASLRSRKSISTENGSLIEKNWGIAHMQQSEAVKSPSTQRTLLDPLDAIKATDIINPEELPYTFVVRQGFKFKCLMRHKSPFVSVLHHLRVPAHYQDGSLGYDNEKNSDDERDETNSAEEDEEVDEVDEVEKKDESTGRPSGKAITIATLDRTSTINLWDLSKLSASKPKLSAKMGFHIEAMIFISRYAMYAAVVSQKGIKFCTSKAEVTCGLLVPHEIQLLKYSEKFNELVVVGLQTITIWSLNAIYHKGQVKIEPYLRLTLEIGLEDEMWIDTVFVDSRNKQIWIAIDVHLMIFNYWTGEKIDFLQNFSARKISYITNHASYQYTLVGSMDGTLKVINISRAVVHEFFAHTKGVTGITVYPYGPLVLTCGLDYCVRMFNLKSFREIFSFHVRERPLGMELIGDTQLYIYTRNTVEIWTTNQINTNLMPLDEKTTSMFLYKVDDNLSRMVVRSSDGVIRIVSPSNGRTIAASLPLLETDSVRDMAYSPILNRLFVMCVNGEIWVFNTAHNPITIVELWSSLEMTLELCTGLVLMEGVFQKTGYGQKPQDIPFAFICGASSNGHLLLYGRSGVIIDRYQLHFGVITDLLFEPSRRILISAGKDNAIRITRLYPMRVALLEPILMININFIPHNLCIIDDLICVSSEDTTIRMFAFDLDNADWRSIPLHSKVDDHTDGVVAICAIPDVKLFISVGRDATIKLWNQNNALLREVQFQEQIDGICVANGKGDLNVAISNRIDVVRAKCYLPPGYLKILETMYSDLVHKNEQLISFDDALIPLTRAPKRNGRKRPLHVDRGNPDNIFLHTNLYFFEDGNDLIDQILYKYVPQNDVFEADKVLNELGKIFRLKQSKVENIKIGPISKLENLDETTIQQNVSQQTVQSQVAASTQQIVQETPQVADEACECIQGESIVEIIPCDAPDIPVREDSVIKTEQEKKQEELRVAYDGYLPNSSIVGEVNQWMIAHKKQTLDMKATNSFKKQQLKIKHIEEIVHMVQKTDFKAKLKEMMKKNPKSERATADIDDADLSPEQHKRRLGDLNFHGQIRTLSEDSLLYHSDEQTEEQSEGQDQTHQILLDSQKSNENILISPQNPELLEVEPTVRIEEEASDLISISKRVVQIERSNSMIPDEVIVPVQTKLSPLVEQMMMYSWFPDVEIFHALKSGLEFDPKLIITNSKGHRMRNLKISPEPDVLLGIALKLFDKSNLDIQWQILDFIKWIDEEYGFKDTSNFESMLIKTLLDSASSSMSSQELESHKRMLDTLAEFNPNLADFLVISIIYSLSFYDVLRHKGLNYIRSAGAPAIESNVIQDKLKEIFEKQTQEELAARASLLSSAPKPDIKPKILEFLLENLRLYLIDTAKTEELASKVKSLTIYGLPEQVHAPTKAKKKGKKGHSDATHSLDPKVTKSKLKAPNQGSKSTVASAPKNVTFNQIPEVKILTNSIEQDETEENKSEVAELEVTLVPELDSFAARAVNVENNVQELRDRKFETCLDPTYYPVTKLPTITIPSSDRTPADILQTPTAFDFVNAINYHVYFKEEEARKIEQERKEREYKESAQAEIERQKALAIAKEIEFKAQKAAERAQKEKERQQKLESMKKKSVIKAQEIKAIMKATTSVNTKHGGATVVDTWGPVSAQSEGSHANLLPVVKTRPRSTPQSAASKGKTHQSLCHRSREGVDIELQRFPPIPHGISKPFNGSMTVYQETFNKAMPVEQVTVKPFLDIEEEAVVDDENMSLDSPSGYTIRTPKHGPTRPTSQRSAVSTPYLRSTLSTPYSETQYSTISELDYIRGFTPQIEPAFDGFDADDFQTLDVASEIIQRQISSAAPTAKFKPGRRYFVHGLSVPADGNERPSSQLKRFG